MSFEFYSELVFNVKKKIKNTVTFFIFFESNIIL